jgi:hypothetical protein
MFKEYMFYSWIDFGISLPENSKLYKNININKLPNKIIYQHLGSNLSSNKLPLNKIYMLPEKEEITDPNNMLSSHVVYFAGSIFIIHNDLVFIYEKLYDNKLQELQEKNIVDDDQNIVLQIYLDNKELFFMPEVKNYPDLNIFLGQNEWIKLYEFF